MTTIYDWLDEVEARPGMYFTRLSDLEAMIHGYRTALSNHRIDEGVPDLMHFGDWLRRKTGWSMSCGWADAIARNVEPDVQAERFFELLKEYRSLRAVVVASVVLNERHAPTGKRVIVGKDGRMDRPARTEIVEYQPLGLQHLRFIYRDRTETQRFLMEDAKRWMEEEFGVAATDWTRSTPE